MLPAVLRKQNWTVGVLGHPSRVNLEDVSTYVDKSHRAERLSVGKGGQSLSVKKWLT